MLLHLTHYTAPLSAVRKKIHHINNIRPVVVLHRSFSSIGRVRGWLTAVATDGLLTVIVNIQRPPIVYVYLIQILLKITQKVFRVKKKIRHSLFLQDEV